MKPSLTGEAKLALAGWEDEVVFLALGVLVGLERLGAGAKRWRPKRGPGGLFSFDGGGGLDVMCMGWV